jgi:phosphoenolpyruvate synthase/pyruvate phosphate dikinase
MNPVLIKIDPSSKIDTSCGTKAIALAELSQLGMNVPDFYVVPSFCFDRFIRNANIISPLDFYAKSEYEVEHFKSFQLVDSFEVSGENICDGKYMVRSSSVPDEYSDLHLFPSMISGVFESYSADIIHDIYKKVIDIWKSLYTKKAYDQCRILSDKPFVKSIGVIIQKYIEPVVSGVVHTMDNIITVNWIEGHLSGIVRGETIGNTIDAYFSNSGDSILRGIEENILLIKNNNMVEVFISLLRQSKIIKQHYQTEIEIEWLFDGEKVWIVQSQTLLSKS